MWTDSPVCICERGVWGRGNLDGLVIGLVPWRGPIHLCACVSEECGDGEGTDSQTLSDTLRYINLTG